MPRIVNGHKPPEPENVNEPHRQLANKILIEFRDLWVEKQKLSQDDPMIYTKMSVVALTQLAAILAVDSGMSSQQFLNVCKFQFDITFQNAPRFS